MLELRGGIFLTKTFCQMGILGASSRTKSRRPRPPPPPPPGFLKKWPTPQPQMANKSIRRQFENSFIIIIKYLTERSCNLPTQRHIARAVPANVGGTGCAPTPGPGPAAAWAINVHGPRKAWAGEAGEAEADAEQRDPHHDQDRPAVECRPARWPRGGGWPGIFLRIQRWVCSKMPPIKISVHGSFHPFFWWCFFFAVRPRNPEISHPKTGVAIFVLVVCFAFFSHTFCLFVILSPFPVCGLQNLCWSRTQANAMLRGVA